MGGSSLSTRPTTFGLSKPLLSSSLGPLFSSRTAASIGDGCIALSTALMGSSLSFIFLYLTGNVEQSRLCSGHNSNGFKWPVCQQKVYLPHAGPKRTPFKWLDYPDNYVPPKMDLFSDDNVPFGFPSSPSCPIDTEHLEWSFGLLRYQHAVKQLGVPSVVIPGIRIVTCQTGSHHGGTSTNTQSRVFGSTSPDGSPNPFLDRPSGRRNGGSNNGGGSNSGSSPGGNRANRPGILTPTGRKPLERPFKVVRFVLPPPPSPPPPPPPPPPGPSDAEDDNHDPRFSSSNWDVAWMAIVLGAGIGHLLSRLLSNGQSFSRTVFKAAHDLDILKRELDISGDNRMDLELDSDVTTLPGFVDEVFQMDSPANYTDVCMKRNHADNQPVKNLSDLAANTVYDAFLRQFLTFSADTGRALVVVLLLVLYTVLQGIIPGDISRLSSTTPAAIRDDQCEETNDTRVEPNDDTVCTDTESPVEAPAPDEDLDVNPTVIFGNALLLANESQAPVEAPSAPVEDFDVEPTTVVHEYASFWAAESPVEKSVSLVDHVRAEVEDYDIPLIVVEQAHVEASAPESDSPFDESGGSDHALLGTFPSRFASTKSFSRVVALDSFNWDRHSSFGCSTPLTQQAGTLSAASSFNYGRGFSEESLDISVPDSDVANAIATTGIPTIAANALQELEKTKKHLDTIIEAQIKRAESSYGTKPRLDPFDAHIQRMDVNQQRSLSTSIWTCKPSGQGGRFVPSAAGSSSSARLNVEDRSFTWLPHVPSNHITVDPEPDTTPLELETPSERAQQVPGRRRRHRPRGRNRGRGPSGEQFVEEDAEEDVSSDVPDWANA